MNKIILRIAKFLTLFEIRKIQNSSNIFNISGNDGYKFISVNKDEFKNTKTYFIDDWVNVESSYVEVLKIDNESWGRSHNWGLRPVIMETADGEFKFYIYSEQEGNGAFGQFNSTLDYICDENKKSISFNSIDNFKGTVALASTKKESLLLIENFANCKNLKFRIAGATGDEHKLSDLSNENLKSHFQLLATDFLRRNDWDSEIANFRNNLKNHLINNAINNNKIKATFLIGFIAIVCVVTLDKFSKFLF